MTYNLSLANMVPTSSAFTVMVNSVARTVNSVSISGTKVTLTLAGPVVSGNTITVAYTKPATNPLQTTSGGQAGKYHGKGCYKQCQCYSAISQFCHPEYYSIHCGNDL